MGALAATGSASTLYLAGVDPSIYPITEPFIQYLVNASYSHDSFTNQLQNQSQF